MKLSASCLRIIACICVVLCLAACGGKDIDPTVTPTSPTTTPTVAPIDAEKLYSDAVQAMVGVTDMTIRYTWDISRIAGGETYTESRNGTAIYAGIGTDTFEAMVSEDVCYGSYNVSFIESYIGGCAYSRVNNCSYRSDITADAFMALQLPAVMLDQAMYTDITAEVNGDDTILSFNDPTAAENWLQLDEQAVLLHADGKATLDASGNLTGSEYHIEYSLGTIVWTVNITATAEMAAEDLSAQHPVYGENCPTLSHLRIPRYLLQVVGDVYTAENITAEYSDTLYSEAYGAIRNQSTSFATSGSGDGFMAALDSQVSVTDSLGNSESNAQSITFRDGIYTSTVNSNDPVSDSSVAADYVRTLCEDSILSSLLTLEAIQSAELTDTGDFLYITFTANETFTEGIYNSIYALFSMDLDSWADKYSTNDTTAYLTISKHTGLPTAMGMSLSRTHSKDSVSYKLSYQLDQSVVLSNPDAYETITGEPADDPDAQSATPLLYKVTGANGQTMYLLGTIHIGDSRTAKLPEELMTAFNEANALAVEMDTIAFEEAVQTDTALQLQVAQAYYYSGGTVTSHLSKELYQSLYPLMMATGCNNVNSSYLKLGIWQSLLETLYMQQDCRLTSGQGMDTRLLKWAKETEKPIYEIESGISQLKVLTGFSDKLQEMLLQQLLDSGVIAYCTDIQELYDAWCQGDEQILTEMLQDDTSSLTDEELKLLEEYNKTMVTNRNKQMHKAAVAYLESGETVFYAVGLAHLLGEGGLVESLRSAGYTVEIVTYAQ